MDKNILVTGGTGFIGRNLIETLAKKENNVTALVRKSSNIIKLKNRGIHIVYGDINDLSSLKTALTGIDIVYHCAGYVRNASLKKLFRVNVEGTRNICQAALETGINRLIYTSSIAVISGNKQIPLTDDLPYSSTNNYGLSKLEAEKIVIEYRNKGLKTAILRPCMVYGPGEPHALNFLLNLIRWRLIPIIADGNAHWHLVHVNNVVNALILAGYMDQALSGTYIVADKEVLTVKEILNLMADAMGVKQPWHISKKFIPILSITPFIKDKLKFFLKDRIYNISCIIKKLGYNPAITTKEGLRKVIQYQQGINK